MSSEENNEGLKRVVGVFGLSATVVNFSIGAGIMYFLQSLVFNWVLQELLGICYVD